MGGEVCGSLAAGRTGRGVAGMREPGHRHGGGSGVRGVCTLGESGNCSFVAVFVLVERGLVGKEGEEEDKY